MHRFEQDVYINITGVELYTSMQKSLELLSEQVYFETADKEVRDVIIELVKSPNLTDSKKQDIKSKMKQAFQKHGKERGKMQRQFLFIVNNIDNATMTKGPYDGTNYEDIIISVKFPENNVITSLNIYISMYKGDSTFYYDIAYYTYGKDSSDDEEEEDSSDEESVDEDGNYPWQKTIISDTDKNKRKRAFKTLGLDDTATQKQIQQAWKKKSRQSHPDKNRNGDKAKEKQQQINGARDTLLGKLIKLKF